ncbi:putative signal peptide protein [Puccinia sorghi]|uniref:Putative signal peptide protein n=1 Tax=Puccinia sorghi TaxID=27349 RepID=A0A0L6VES7_9BASI|nr:putative signal peptide protein [Puccinia sorghi]
MSLRRGYPGAFFSHFHPFILHLSFLLLPFPSSDLLSFWLPLRSSQDNTLLHAKYNAEKNNNNPCEKWYPALASTTGYRRPILRDATLQAHHYGWGPFHLHFNMLSVRPFVTRLTMNCGPLSPTADPPLDCGQARKTSRDGPKSVFLFFGSRGVNMISHINIREILPCAIRETRVSTHHDSFLISSMRYNLCTARELICPSHSRLGVSTRLLLSPIIAAAVCQVSFLLSFFFFFLLFFKVQILVCICAGEVKRRRGAVIVEADVLFVLTREPSSVSSVPDRHHKTGKLFRLILYINLIRRLSQYRQHSKRRSFPSAFFYYKKRVTCTSGGILNLKTDEQYYGCGKKSCDHVPGERAPMVADADSKERKAVWCCADNTLVVRALPPSPVQCHEEPAVSSGDPLMGALQIDISPDHHHHHDLSTPERLRQPETWISIDPVTVSDPLDSVTAEGVCPSSPFLILKKVLEKGSSSGGGGHDSVVKDARESGEEDGEGTGSADVAADPCAVCREEIGAEGGAGGVSTVSSWKGCEHRFHTACIQGLSRCPLCRRSHTGELASVLPNDPPAPAVPHGRHPRLSLTATILYRLTCGCSMLGAAAWGCSFWLFIVFIGRLFGGLCLTERLTPVSSIILAAPGPSTFDACASPDVIFVICLCLPQQLPLYTLFVTACSHLSRVLGERTGTSGGREHGIGYSRIRGFQCVTLRQRKDMLSAAQRETGFTTRGEGSSPLASPRCNHLSLSHHNRAFVKFAAQSASHSRPAQSPKEGLACNDTFSAWKQMRFWWKLSDPSWMVFWLPRASVEVLVEPSCFQSFLIVFFLNLIWGLENQLPRIGGPTPRTKPDIHFGSRRSNSHLHFGSQHTNLRKFRLKTKYLYLNRDVAIIGKNLLLCQLCGTHNL